MRQKFTRKCACPSASSSSRRLLAFMRFPSRGTAAFTRVVPSRQESSDSTTVSSHRSYTPSSSFLIPGKDFPISKWRAQKTAPASTTTLSTDSTSIVIRALEIHRTRTEKLRKETSEKARVEREKEKKRLLDVQREQTLGKIQKAQKELSLLGEKTTTTVTKKKREEEDTSGKEENPFARTGNKKAKKGGKRAKNSR